MQTAFGVIVLAPLLNTGRNVPSNVLLTQRALGTGDGRSKDEFCHRHTLGQSCVRDKLKVSFRHFYSDPRSRLGVLNSSAARLAREVHLALVAAFPALHVKPLLLYGSLAKDVVETEAA